MALQCAVLSSRLVPTRGLARPSCERIAGDQAVVRDRRSPRVEHRSFFHCVPPGPTEEELQDQFFIRRRPGLRSPDADALRTRRRGDLPAELAYGSHGGSVALRAAG